MSMIETIKAFTGQKPIVIYPIYLDITGDYATAAALGQVIYWHEVMRGKFYKTDSDFEQELHLTPKQFRRVKTELKLLPFLKITVEQIPAKTFYDVDYELLAALIGQIRMSQKGQTGTAQKGQTGTAQKGQTGTAQKGQTGTAQKGQTNTENTTENTTEITRNNDNDRHNQAQAVHVHDLLSSLSFEKTKHQKEKVKFPIIENLNLTDEEKAEANEKLASLATDQRNIAIQAISKNKSIKRIMAYINKMYEKGIEGNLKPFITTPEQNLTPIQESQSMPISDEIKDISDETKEKERKEREARLNNTRLEIIKDVVKRRKPELLDEFNAKGFVLIRGLNGAVIREDLKAAGLFD